MKTRQRSRGRCPIRCALAFAAVFLGLASCSSQQPGTPTTTRPAIAPVVTSKQIPTLHRQWLNLAYANHSNAEKLDLYLTVHRPAHSGLPGLVVIYVHGGAWLAGHGDKATGFPGSL